MGAMLMNMAANMLGLGNAATPLGLRAMRDLESLNPHPGAATNAMCTFLAINSASFGNRSAPSNRTATAFCAKLRRISRKRPSSTLRDRLIIKVHIAGVKQGSAFRTKQNSGGTENVTGVEEFKRELGVVG